MNKIFSFIVLLVCSVAGVSQTQNFWTQKNDFGAGKRERAVGFSLNNKGYLGTGIDTNETVKNDWWEYDPLTDAWTQKANVPGSVRRNAVGFAIGNRGYVGTGYDSSEAGGIGSTLKDFWEYNPQTNSWTQKADYPGGGGNGVYFATAFSLDNKGFVVCGKIGPDNYIDDVWEYKPVSNSWLKIADFPGGQRYQLCSFVIGGEAYVGLGTDYNTHLDDIWRYNGGSGVWTRMNDFGGGHRASVSTFTLGERGFVCLGTNGGLCNDLWEYNPYLDSWTARASYGGSSRRNSVAFTAYGKAYVGTGDAVNGKRASMFEYTPMLILDVDESIQNSVRVWYSAPYDQLQLRTEDEVAVTIYDVAGNRIWEQLTVRNAESVDTQGWSRGVYVVELRGIDSGLYQVKKVCVQ